MCWCLEYPTLTTSHILWDILPLFGFMRLLQKKEADNHVTSHFVPLWQAPQDALPGFKSRKVHAFSMQTKSFHFFLKVTWSSTLPVMYSTHNLPLDRQLLLPLHVFPQLLSQKMSPSPLFKSTTRSCIGPSATLASHGLQLFYYILSTFHWPRSLWT